MENSWQMKRGSLWQQPYAPPPAPPLDYMLSNMHGHDNSGNAELGASFLSLISGPSAHVPSDQQHLFYPNTVPISSPLPPSLRTAHVFPGRSTVSVLPNVSWLRNMDHPNLNSGGISPPLALSNANVNCSNNSQILQAESLDVRKSPTVLCQNSHDKVKVKSLYPPSANNTSSMYPHLTTSQKIPVEGNASASSSFLRVSCSGLSGRLLLNDTGLLGVVCTCHGLYMSISKFSEHSGSCDVDPGNAVCMDSGETIAHWWKAFTNRTEIRTLEGHKGWDWPEETSVASGLRNHSMSNNSILLNQVGSSIASVSYQQKNHSVINSQENYSYSNIVDENLCHDTYKSSRECNNSFLEYLRNSFHENLPHAVGQHACRLQNSFCVNSRKASQSVAPALDMVCESANTLPASPNLQDLITSCSNSFSDGQNNSSPVERLGVSSSIDLRLGQPPEKSETLDTKHKLANGSNLNAIHEEPPEVFFQDKLLHTTSNVWQGSRSILQYTDIYSNPSKRKAPTKLEHSHSVEGAYGATTACWKDSWKIDFRNTKTKCQLRNNYENSNHSHVDEKIHYEYRASERDRTYLPWSSLAVSTVCSNVNEEKQVECDFNSLLSAAKSNIEVSKELKGKVSNLNIALGKISAAFQVRSLDDYHMSTTIAEKSYGREFLKNYWKLSSVSDITYCNSDHVKCIQNPIVSEETPLGFRSRNSAFAYDVAPTLPKEKLNAIKNGFPFKNMEIPATWNMSELSDRDNGPPVGSVQESEVKKIPSLHSLMTTAPSVSKDPTQLLDALEMPKSSEMVDKSALPGCWMGHNCERFRMVTGRSLCTKDTDIPPRKLLSLSSTPEEKHFTEQNDLHDDKSCNNLVKGNQIGAATVVYSKDASTAEVRNISFADTLVLHKGSGNGRSCSSDDELNSELCGSASKINLIKREPFKLVPRKQSLSLIEEIRLQNSLQSKRSYIFHEDSDHLQMSELVPEKKRKAVKWMRLDVSGHLSTNNRSPKCCDEVGHNANSSMEKQMQLGQDRGSSSNCGYSVRQSDKCTNSASSAAKWASSGKAFQKVHHQGEKQETEAHKTLVVDDTLESSEMFRAERLRLNDASTRPVDEFTAKSTSLCGCSDSSNRSNFRKWMVKPTVCGKYGVISNGNPSKPVKFILLSEVLKTVASLAYKSNKKVNYRKQRSKPVKVKKMSGRHVVVTALGKKVLRSHVKRCGTHSLLPIKLELTEKEKLDTASWSSASNGSDYPSYAKCNNPSITDRKTEYKLKTKFKEGRHRSLHELLFKENSSSLCQTTSRCCEEVMPNAVDGRAQTSERDKTTGCTEKHQPETSDRFCCVCGGSDKDEHDQLLHCNRFLLKNSWCFQTCGAHGEHFRIGLWDEAEALDNNNTGFYLRCTPYATSHAESNTERLQDGEKFLVCARTEGYKEREGFFPRDTNQNSGCLVPEDQLNAWLHIHQQKSQRRGHPKLSTRIVESDCGKAYTRYKQSKSWKHLVVYKSGIHALGLYTSRFIFRRAMVVEYVGEIVGLRVADKRESEYQSGKKLQHKSACYFFRVDKERIIDATHKGGIARFVNHSCEPNCVAKVISAGTEKKVVFFADRDIYPGEEITYDYNFNNEDGGEKIPCYCNSNNCRLFLN